MFKNNKIVISIAIIFSLLIGFSSLYTPKPKDSNNSGFSSERAKEDIKEISKDVHSVLQQDNLKEVRDYILGRLSEIGLNPEVFTYENITDKYDNTYDVNNIYAKIDGKDGEDGNYIMLATHYDSSPRKRAGEDPNSKGAADAGYGISTILEIAKLIKDNNIPLENGIKFLITDAEETGLLGAKQEMDKNFDLYKNVSYVVNIEARGVKGPAMMFETSNNNSKVIDLYKEANLPFSYSLAADVYRKMPNGSDFTEFNNKNIPGINIAVLDSLDYYHTYRDNFENISDTSIQHYGEQILPIVEEFIYSEKYSEDGYFDSKENSIFFTLLPNVFISYSNTVGIVLAAIAIIGLALVVINSKKKYATIKYIDIAKSTLISLFAGILVALSGILISFVLSKIYNMKFSLTYMPKIPIALGVFIASILLISILVYLLFKRLVSDGMCEKSLLFGGLIFNTILLVVFMFVLPGASFLFLFPVLLSLIAILLKKKEFMIIPVMFSIVMYAPILYMLYIALTIGALGVILLLLAAMLVVVVPCIIVFTKEKQKIDYKSRI